MASDCATPADGQQCCRAVDHKAAQGLQTYNLYTTTTTASKCAAASKPPAAAAYRTCAFARRGTLHDAFVHATQHERHLRLQICTALKFHGYLILLQCRQAGRWGRAGRRSGCHAGLRGCRLNGVAAAALLLLPLLRGMLLFCHQPPTALLLLLFLVPLLLAGCALHLFDCL